MLGCQPGATAKAVSHLHPRHKQMKDMRRFEGTMGPLHVILLQEAESHIHEIVEISAEQFHIYHGADHPILFHKICSSLEV